MNIYEKISIYTAKDYGNDATLADIDRKSNKHYDTICDIMKTFGKDEEGSKYQMAWISEEISPEELQEATENTNIKGYIFNETLTDSYEKNQFIEEITIFTKKEIDDNLSKEEQDIEEEKYMNQLISDIHQLDKIPDFVYDWDSHFTNDKQILLYDVWAFEELHNKEEQKNIIEKTEQECINKTQFLLACSLGSKNGESDIDFLKKVIKKWGINEPFKRAIVSISKDKDSANQLYKEIQSTDEYKKAYQQKLADEKTIQWTGR